MRYLRFYTLLIFLFYSKGAISQQLNANGGVLLKAEITLGNQNQWLKIGTYAFGVLNYGDISVESGISLAGYQLFKRHTIKNSGIGYQYEFFALGGLGKNTNLLGSTISPTNTTFFHDPKGKTGFNGIGFGFSRDLLPKKLASYGIQRGALLMRFSNANHSIHFAFQNDFKIGMFKGAGTDYAATGSFSLGFTRIYNESLQQIGVGIDLFTPQPDYSRSPRNTINSQDGRKNVWFTLPPYKDLFYGNLFVYGNYQKENYSLYSKIGINSQKTGAYIQNILHDGLGLNPRFPWNVSQKDRIFIELGGSLSDQLPKNNYDE